MSRGDWKTTKAAATAAAAATSAPLAGHHTKRPLNARAPSPRRASPPTCGSLGLPANPRLGLLRPAYRAAAPLSVTDSPPSALYSSPQPVLLQPPPLPLCFHSRAPQCSLTRTSACTPRTPAVHFLPATRLFPMFYPLPWPHPLAQLRSGVRASPLRDMSVQPITAIRSHPLPFSAAAGQARSPVRAAPGTPWARSLPATLTPPPALGLARGGYGGALGAVPNG